MDLLKIVQENNLGTKFEKSVWGIERESLRAKGKELAQTDHPSSLGSRESHPYIITDYSDSQPEIITPPLSPLSFAYHWLSPTTYVLMEAMEQDEYLWPFSMPCQLPEKDKDITISTHTSQKLKQYRLETAEKYGRKRQLISGIHLNFSLPDDLFWQLFQAQDQFDDQREFENAIYLKTARNFLTHQWLLIYLFGATPVANETFYQANFFEGRTLPEGPVRSLRNSSYGYQNKSEFSVSYESVEDYVADIDQALSDDLLEEEREYYENVRLRHSSNRNADLKRHGIEYLEFRLFDLNPFSPLGLDSQQLIFIYLFIMTMLLMEENADSQDVEAGKIRALAVAAEDPYSQTADYQDGEDLIDAIAKVAEVLSGGDAFTPWLEDYKEHLTHPDKTLSAQLTDLLKEDSYLSLGEKIGQKHKEALLDQGSEWPGFESLWPAQKMKLAHAIKEGRNQRLMNSDLYRDQRRNYSDWLLEQIK